jgi:hypothetical protein
VARDRPARSQSGRYDGKLLLATGAKKVEYKIAQAGPNMSPKQIEEVLNQLGEDGWLLVHALPGLGFILRR